MRRHVGHSHVGGQPPEQQSIDPYALRRQCRSPSNRPDELPDGLAPLDAHGERELCELSAL